MLVMADKKFAPSENLVPVKAVLDEHRPGSGSAIIMNDGSFRIIIQTGAVNFDMKAPLEQAGLAGAFGSMLNNLDVDFPLEIVSHAKRLDVDAYVRQFETRLQSSKTPPQIRRLIQSHKEHFEDQVKVQNLLQRQIYITIPWKSNQGPLSPSFADDVPFSNIFKRVMKNTEEKLVQKVPTDLEVSQARQQLDIRADQVCDRIHQMGIKTARLDVEGVRKLLYEFYNPSLAQIQSDPGQDSGGSMMGAFSLESPIRGGRQ